MKQKAGEKRGGTKRKREGEMRTKKTKKKAERRGNNRRERK